MFEEEADPTKAELSFETLRRIRELQLEAKRQEAAVATDQQQLRDRVKQLETVLTQQSANTHPVKKKLSRIAGELSLLNARIINEVGGNWKNWKPNFRLSKDAERAGVVADVHRLTAEMNMLAHIDVAPVDDTPALTQLQDAVYATLFGEVMGYSDMCLLLEHIIEDSGIDAEESVRTLGYKSVIDFLRSDEMSSKVHASDALGTIVYYAIPTAQNFHQRLEQLKSVVQASKKKTKRAKNRAQKADMVARSRDRKGTRKERRTDLEQCLRASQEKVHDAEERLQATREQLRHYEKAFGCLCKDSCVEVIYGCGHGCCTKCDEKWTKRDAEEERPVDPAARFRPNADVPLVYGTGPPTCPWCRVVITARTKVY